jgi:hypothetical protein
VRRSGRTRITVSMVRANAAALGAKLVAVQQAIDAARMHSE